MMGSVPHPGRSSNGILFAVRPLSAEFASGASSVTLTPLGGGLYSFPTNQVLAVAPFSYVDIRGTGILAPIVGSGFAELEGSTPNTGATGTLQDLGGGQFSITYPVSVSFSQDLSPPLTATYILNGSVVATGTLTPVPEPASILGVVALAGGAVGLGRRARRRAG